MAALCLLEKGGECQPGEGKGVLLGEGGGGFSGGISECACMEGALTTHKRSRRAGHDELQNISLESHLLKVASTGRAVVESSSAVAPEGDGGGGGRQEAGHNFY